MTGSLPGELPTTTTSGGRPRGGGVSLRGWTEPADVLVTLRRRWDAGIELAAFAFREPFEPIQLPIRGPSAGDLAARFGEAQDWTTRWERAAGRTLRLEYGDIGGRRVGANRIIRRLWIDSAEQLWRHLGVQSEVDTYLALVQRTELVAPEVLTWMRSRPRRVLELQAVWDLLVQTVVWIDSNAAASGLYLRQLDVPGVDTKFVERHRAVLSALLDLRLDSSRIDIAAPSTDFVGRYGFLRKPSYVRFRLLDRPSSVGFSEMTVRTEELARSPLTQRRIFAVENEITYLAFPDVADAAVIFGGGYAIAALTPLSWLADRELVYWGDLDTHGFAILDLVRQRFPSTSSMLMDRRTLFAHESQWVTEPSQSTGHLEHLTSAEQRLYEDLVENTFGSAVRLEQERIRFSAVQQALSGLTDARPSQP